MPYMLLNSETGATFALFEGRNLIGRSPSVVDDVFFINLESPRFAISRVHAEIVVAPNGDVWISDAASTNGTQMAVRDGCAIALAAKRSYYCVSGTMFLFGDVKLVLVIDSIALSPQQSSGPSPLHGPFPNRPPSPRTLSDIPVCFVTRAWSTSRRSDALEGDSYFAQPESSPVLINGAQPSSSATMIGAPTASREHQRTSPESSHLSIAHRQVFENAHESEGSELPQPHSKHMKCGADADDDIAQATVACSRKHSRNDGDDEAFSLPRKANRSENGTLTCISATVAPMTVCFSGFGSNEKRAFTILVKSRKGRVVDNMSDENVDVLVVCDPPTRTPKFLIAMGRGCPIVTPSFLEDAAPISRAFEYIPDLVHDGKRYTSKRMRQVLQRTRSNDTAKARGVLFGRCFFISDSVGVSKNALVHVITSCGGRVTDWKNDQDADLVTDGDEVYRKLLIGEYIGGVT